jgi:hypothetical protein
VTLVLLDVRSLLILMVVGELTVVVLSQERITAKSIDQQLTLLDGSLNLSSTLNSLDEHWFNSHTPLVLLSHFLFSLRHTEPVTRHLMNSSRSSERTLTCVQVSLCRNLIWPSQSTSKPLRMVTSLTRTFLGRSQRP